MPLFKRREQAEHNEVPAAPAASTRRILSEPEIREHLDEEAGRARRYGRPLIVLCLVPQKLPGEVLRPGELESVADIVRTHLRQSDRVGALDTGVLVAVLPETDFAGARVAAHRLSADLAIRSTGTQARNWLPGVAEFPADGEDASALIDSAMARAHR